MLCEPSLGIVTFKMALKTSLLLRLMFSLALLVYRFYRIHHRDDQINKRIKLDRIPDGESHPGRRGQKVASAEQNPVMKMYREMKRQIDQPGHAAR